MSKIYKDDKIFRNSYHHGNSLKGDNYHFDKGIKADEDNLLNSTFFTTSSPEDIYPYTEIRDIIIKLSNEDKKISNILKNNKKKYNTDKINELFELVLQHFDSTFQLKRIKDVIIIFDIITKSTGIKTFNLFDLLKYEYKEMILNELDDKYNIYSFLTKKNKLY